MGLCWSNNTHYWGKDKFPYKESAPLSSRLWMKVAGVRVVVGDCSLSRLVLANVSLDTAGVFRWI